MSVKLTHVMQVVSSLYCYSFVRYNWSVRILFLIIDTPNKTHTQYLCSYYINGREATIDQFYDPEILNELLEQVAVGVQITQASGSKAKVWLGETSSAWGGGAEGLSDRYVAGFM